MQFPLWSIRSRIFAKKWEKGHAKPQPPPLLPPLTLHQPEVVAMVHPRGVRPAGATTVIKTHHHQPIEVRGVRKRKVDERVRVHPDPGQDPGQGRPDHTGIANPAVVIGIKTKVEEAQVLMKVLEDQKGGRGRHLRRQKSLKSAAIKYCLIENKFWWSFLWLLIYKRR